VHIGSYGSVYQLLAAADAQPLDLLHPYCNWADTGWYATS
jgi:hypothetical protein